jgi:Ni/Co efflux regulator RcnB
MTFRFILTGVILMGAILACSALAVGPTQAAPPGALVVADNNDHKDEHKGAPHGGGQAPPGHGSNTMGGPSHGTNTQNHMNMQMYKGPQTPSGGGGAGGTHHDHTQMYMGTQTQMGGGGNQSGGNTAGTHHHGSNTMMMGNGNNNRNFDRQSFQRNFTAPRQFHVRRYRRPHGWYEHRWVFGETLPALFWVQNYWIGDYYDYGLPDPPPGFVWVRYGDDALLVDQNSGEVLQVEYDLFD